MDYAESAKTLFPSIKNLFKFAAMKDLSDVTQGEMAVLSYLAFHHNGAAAGELTHAFSVGTSRTAAILNTLERKGYAVRKADASDKRKVMVYITDAGKKLAYEKQAEAIAHIEALLRRLGETDSENFIRIIQKTACFFNETTDTKGKGCEAHGTETA